MFHDQKEAAMKKLILLAMILLLLLASCAAAGSDTVEVRPMPALEEIEGTWAWERKESDEHNACDWDVMTLWREHEGNRGGGTVYYYGRPMHYDGSYSYIKWEIGEDGLIYVEIPLDTEQSEYPYRFEVQGNTLVTVNGGFVFRRIEEHPNKAQIKETIHEYNPDLYELLYGSEEN